MERLNRQITRKLRLEDLKEDYGYVDATPEERIGMVWPLTREVCSLSPLHAYNAEQRLQRHITRVIRREG